MDAKGRLLDHHILTEALPSVNVRENDDCCGKGMTAPSNSEMITSFSGISSREDTTCSMPDSGLMLEPEWSSAGVLATCMMTDTG